MSASSIYAQDHIESLVQRLADDDNAARMLAQIEEWDGIAIDVNAATQEALMRIPTMLEYEAQRIVEYVAKYGPLRSLSELYSIDAFAPARVRELLPFLLLQPPALRFDWKALAWHVSQRASQAFPLQPPGKPMRLHLGPPIALQTRVTGEFPSFFRVGLKGNKASNEPIFSKYAPAGYPFYTAYAELTLQRGIVRRIIAGDFSARPGHGLVLDASSFILPGGMVSSWGKSLRPRAAFALSDSNLPRGVAITMGAHGVWHLEVGLSAKRTNATLLTKNRKTWLTTLPSSGPFTREASINRRRSMWEGMAYASSSYTLQHFTVGVTAAYVHLQYPMDRNAKHWFQRYVPQYFLRLGPHIAYHAPRVRIYGEGVVEFQSNPGFALPPVTFLFGATRAIGSKWYTGIEVYHYAPMRHNHYQAIYAPTQSVYAGGHGIQASVAARTVKHQGTLSAEIYAGRALDASYAVAPQRYHVQLDYRYQPTDVWIIRGVLRHAQRTYAVGIKNRNERHEAYHEGHLRADYQPEYGWLAVTQLGCVFNAKAQLQNQNPGWAILQDVGFRAERFTLKARLGFFRLEEAARALYFYEQSPLYAFTIRRHAHNELRAYLYAKWQPYPRITLWAKIAHSLRFEGNTPSNNPLPIEAMMQLAYRFN